VDGESGLVAAKERQPHIVLLDIAMQGIDGFEICRSGATFEEIWEARKRRLKHERIWQTYHCN
jgi:CheY-like chemotaxis protein